MPRAKPGLKARIEGHPAKAINQLRPSQGLSPIQKPSENFKNL